MKPLATSFQKTAVRIYVCALQCRGAGKIEKGLSWPASALNCTSSAASSAAASASRPGSIVTKMASTLCSASATASIPAGQLASDPACAQAFFARRPTLRPRHAACRHSAKPWSAPTLYGCYARRRIRPLSTPNRRNRPPQPRCNVPAQPAELQAHARIIGFLDDATLPRAKCFNGNSGDEEKPRTILNVRLTADEASRLA